MKMRHEPESAIMALPHCEAVPRFPEPMPEDVIRRCYELWMSAAGRNARVVVLKYRQEVEEDAPIPSERTVRRWAQKHGWAAQADADWDTTAGKTLFELQMGLVGAFREGIENLQLVGAGAFDDNPMAAAARLKAYELAQRTIERGTLPLMPKRDKTMQREFDKMSLEEQEAAMREALTTWRDRT